MLTKFFTKLLFAAAFLAAFLLLTPGAPAQTKIDEFGYANAEESMARLDSFLSTLDNDPSLRGYIIVYGPRSPKKGELRAHIREMSVYLKIRRFDASRITFIEGGYRDHDSVIVTIWTAAPGDSKPVPEDTLDDKEVKFLKSVFRKKSLYLCC